jgi:hypothetical protein
VSLGVSISFGTRAGRREDVCEDTTALIRLTALPHQRRF